jgi:putative tryptophan/tyrosine transport system substrate-binding protein
MLRKKSPRRRRTSLGETATSLGRKVRILRAANEGEIHGAFRTIVQENLAALFVAADAYFVTRRFQIIALAAYLAIPAFYSRREFAEAGGLASYSTYNCPSTRQEGIYVGRILKGERPVELPVVQASKFELVINLKTAGTLGVQFPASILALADVVIE